MTDVHGGLHADEDDDIDEEDGADGEQVDVDATIHRPEADDHQAGEEDAKDGNRCEEEPRHGVGVRRHDTTASHLTIDDDDVLPVSPSGGDDGFLTGNKTYKLKSHIMNLCWIIRITCVYRLHTL